MLQRNVIGKKFAKNDHLKKKILKCLNPDLQIIL